VELLLLGVVVEETALEAGVLAELQAAGLAGFVHALNSVAVKASELSHLGPVHLVMLLGVSFLVNLDLIVTEPANVELQTLMTLKFTAPIIVLAPELGLLFQGLGRGHNDVGDVFERFASYSDE
jgi:hypothetical protein